MSKELSQAKVAKFDKVLTESSIHGEIKTKRMTEKEVVELKSYSIKKALKIKRYVRA